MCAFMHLLSVLIKVNFKVTASLAQRSALGLKRNSNQYWYFDIYCCTARTQRQDGAQDVNLY